ncbi:MAG: hypothetical protein RI947_749 [Candidatus Parcubacteria bacterium]|jgi:HAE1 family hydrophobic/amphiphilic exporter-1
MDNFKSYLQQLRFDPKLWNTLQAKWITNIRLVILLVIAIIVTGVVSVLNLPRRVNPEVKIPIITVATVLPGANPEDVESLITQPLEDALLGMDKLDTVTSTSRDSVSVVVMQFISSANRDKARDDVQSLVDTVTLPEDAQTPKVVAIDFENQPIWSFTLSSTGDPGTLMRFADNLKDKIEENTHVKNVDISGFETQEISIMLDPQKMREYNINPALLSQSVQKSASAYPAGTIENADSLFSLTIDPDITTVNDIRNIHISSQGTVIKLGDIAAVEEKSKTNQVRSFVADPTKRVRQAVTFYVYKTSSANIDSTANEVVKLSEEAVSTHKDQFHITTIVNAGEMISEQYRDLLKDFASTIILVFINLLLFLGLRQALLASFTIPLTFLSGFVVMQIFGLSINFISLFAFLLALGTSIDDTIVTVSSMTSYYRAGKFTPQETGLLVWRDFIVPIWSTTITTIWAFLPLLLTTGIIGEFIKPIPLVVTATMISSTLYAVTVTLPLLIVILKPHMPRRVVTMLKILLSIIAIVLLIMFIPKTSLMPIILIACLAVVFVFYRVRRSVVAHAVENIPYKDSLTRAWDKVKHWSQHGVINSEWLGLTYRKTITRILHSQHGIRNTLIAVISFALFSYMLVPFGLVKNEFFPQSESSTLYVNVAMSPGTTVKAVEIEALKIADEIRHTPTVRSTVVDIGREFNGQDLGSNGSAALITLILDPIKGRSISSITTAEELRNKYAQYPRATVTVQEESGGPPAGSDIQIKLLGNDLSVLDQYAEKIMAYLKTVKGVADINKSVKPGTSKMSFTPDKLKLSEAGVTVDQIGLLLRTYASGFTLDKIKFDNKEKDVVFHLTSSTTSPEEISSLVIQTQNGAIPLQALGDLRLESNPTVIAREDGKRTIAVSAGVQPGFVIGDINTQLEKYAAGDLHLPAGYTWKTGGVNEENAKSIASIFQAMGLSFLLILVTMVIQFGSYRQAAIVLLLIPLAISGVFIIFALTATPLSFPALIGILALFGIVVANAMFIIDKINRNRDEGMDLHHAISDAAESRLEPIMLTSITTILGLVPITISDPLWRGLGGAIISGLAFSGIIMLFFVPAVYYLWFKNDGAKSLPSR